MKLLTVTSSSNRRQSILLTIVFSNLQNDLPHRVAGFLCQDLIHRVTEGPIANRASLVPALLCRP